MARLWLIKELKEAFRHRLRKKHKQKCPVCEQQWVIYSRKISGPGMARVLVLLSRDRGSEWTHVRKFLVALGMRRVASGGSFVKFHHWGFIESKGPNSGMWRVTEKGHRFVRGEIKAWRTALVQNPGETLLGFVKEDGRASIHEALGTKFNLEDLLKES